MLPPPRLPRGSDRISYPFTDRLIEFIDAGEWKRECCDDSLENIGNANSYVWTGEEWARATNAPWNWYKGFGYEGGIRAPAIVHYGDHERGAINRSVFDVTDVAATVLDTAGVAHPGTTHRGRTVHPIEGESIVPVLSG